MFKFCAAFFLISISMLHSVNQTPQITRPLSGSDLPFKVTIREANFSLETGLNSYVYAIHDGQWLFFAGRTNGLHGFDEANPPSNFSPSTQNTVVYIVNPVTKEMFSRSLYDMSSGLTQEQIDQLSVTASEFFQVDETLYVVGGYGVETSTGKMNTKDTLTAINVPGLIKWVKDSSNPSAASNIRQVSDPLLRVTGGDLFQAGPDEPFLLCFGQNFFGFYPHGVQFYTDQIRAFNIIDNELGLFVQSLPEQVPNPNYRRRDMNTVPIIEFKDNDYVTSFLGLSGVFTPSFGIWTVPVKINADGSSSMENANDPNAFKQGFNNYFCANLGLYSKNTNDMYIVLFGGLSYGNTTKGSPCNPVIPGFLCDSEIPFVNLVSTVRINSNGRFSQYIMDATFPEIIADFSIPSGETLFFGTDAEFLPADQLSKFSNGVFALDELDDSPVLLGYIVGGIASTKPNTDSSNLQTQASAYIFEVILERQ